MGHLKFDQEIFEFFSIRLKEKGFNFSAEDVSTIIGWWTPSYSGTKMIVAIWTRKPHRKEKSKKNE